MNRFRRWSLASAVLNLLTGLAQAQYLISTYAGGLPAPTAAAASGYPIAVPIAIATDRFGNTYISTNNNCVYRLDANGYLSRVAGTGEAGYSGDAGLAVNAQLNTPQGLAIDSAGNLYISDQANQRIRQVTPVGTISTVAGTGTAGPAADGPATEAQLNSPAGLAADSAGNVYVADERNNVIRRFVPGGNITTYVGTGTGGDTGDGGPATQATLAAPVSVAVDGVGNLYIGDASYQVRKVNPAGTITHFAGTGVNGFLGSSPAPAASTAISNPAGLAADAAGNVYIALEYNQVIGKVSPNGTITTYAGGGASLQNGVSALDAEIYDPVGVSVDYAGDLYIAEQDNRIRFVSAATGNTSTVAGTGDFPSSGDGAPPSLAQFGGNWGLAADTSGNLYIADYESHRIREIAAATGLISTFAGTGAPEDSGDGEAATSAGVFPYVVAVDSSTSPATVYLGDYAKVRKVAPSGTISSVAGTGEPGLYSGEGEAATSAVLGFLIAGVAVDSSHNVYISDWANNRVLKVTASTGIITTVAGTGTAGYNGDNKPGTSAEVNSPAGLAVDTKGNLYIADYQNCRVRDVNLTSGTISTIAGTGTCATSGDNGAATSASILNPQGLALDGNGNLYIALEQNSIRVVSLTSGTINTVAGTGTAGYAGDGGLATAALLNTPKSVAAYNGNVYISDSGNAAVRILQSESLPLLQVSSTHTGTFTLGDSAEFEITVSDASLAASTSGPVTLTGMVSPGLTPSSASGTGWSNCTYSSSSYSCQNSSALTHGNSLGTLTLTVAVAGNAPPQVTSQVSVSVGGAGSGTEDLAFVGPSTPSLQISATHFGDFVVGGQGIYTIWVGNQLAAPQTSSTVIVTDNLPSGLSAASFAGTSPDWSCDLATVTCSRSDALDGGALYNPILLTVSPSESGSVTNQASVMGGGDPSRHTASDPTTIVAAVPCNVSGDSSTSVTDVQDEIDQALGMNSPANDLNRDGIVNVTDVQIVIASVLKGTCTI